MEWINRPEQSTSTPRDTCVAQVCVTHDGSGSCIIRWCITRICFIDF